MAATLRKSSYETVIKDKSKKIVFFCLDDIFFASFWTSSIDSMSSDPES